MFDKRDSFGKQSSLEKRVSFGNKRDSFGKRDSFANPDSFVKPHSFVRGGYYLYICYVFEWCQCRQGAMNFYFIWSGTVYFKYSYFSVTN